MKHTMKCLVFPVGLALLLGTACRKLPPFGNLSTNFVVYTKYDTSVSFSSYKTFYVRDTITVSTSNPNDTLWYDANAQAIISEVTKNMVAAGYTQVTMGQHPDLGLQLIGIRNTTIYSFTPGYWWGYPGYGSPCYWGYCGGGGYWYPYWYSYSVSTGTLVIEMADLKDAGDLGKIDILWTGVGNGQVGSSQSFIQNQCLLTVDQSFTQSPYLKAN